jgi:hypothetical protein
MREARAGPTRLTEGKVDQTFISWNRLTSWLLQLVDRRGSAAYFESKQPTLPQAPPSNGNDAAAADIPGSVGQVRRPRPVADRREPASQGVDGHARAAHLDALGQGEQFYWLPQTV